MQSLHPQPEWWSTSPARLGVRGDVAAGLRARVTASFIALVVPALISGCSFQPAKHLKPDLQGADHYHKVALQIDYPNEPVPERKDDFSSYAPHVIHEGPPEYWDLKLEDALKLALQNSPVLRDLGGQVLTNPSIVRTVQQPAIVETDPNIGVEAALSQFDADLSATGNWQNNHRPLNNSFFGGGTRLFQQDLNQYQVQLAKRAATGGQYFLRQNTVYDANNAPANLFPSAWDTNIEMEFRQPLLQGAGSVYNRIAGPNGTVGQPQGVLIARVNTDISLADFELGVRNLISNVENAYWDLYFAYRDLHAKIVARDSALETWRRIHALYATGRRGGEADKEAQARDQYYFFQSEVEDALTGRLFDGTRTNNGSSGGTFRGNPGVYVTERRLRLTMGLPPTDCKLIRPAEEPLQARVAFDWCQLTEEAINRRAELRRQRAVVKRAELALTAARNFLMPRLDAEGLYRWRGLGHTLLNYGDNPEFDNAYQTLFGGHFQEWQLGAQFDMPIGFRQGHAAVRNAQLMLARERAVLREQELQVVHDLSNSVGDVDRTYVVAQTNYNRRVAASQQMAAVQAAFEADTASLLDLVESQRRLADADSRYARSMVEYTLAVKNVMFESNTLLENNGINMAEGPWPKKAYQDAARRDSLRSRPLNLSYVLPQGPITSAGQYPQHIEPPSVIVDEKNVPAGTGPSSRQTPFERLPVPDGTPSGQPNGQPGSAPNGPNLPTVGPATNVPSGGASLPSAPAIQPGPAFPTTLTAHGAAVNTATGTIPQGDNPLAAHGNSATAVTIPTSPTLLPGQTIAQTAPPPICGPEGVGLTGMPAPSFGGQPSGPAAGNVVAAAVGSSATSSGAVGNVQRAGLSAPVPNGPATELQSSRATWNAPASPIAAPAAAPSYSTPGNFAPSTPAPSNSAAASYAAPNAVAPRIVQRGAPQGAPQTAAPAPAAIPSARRVQPAVVAPDQPVAAPSMPSSPPQAPPVTLPPAPAIPNGGF